MLLVLQRLLQRRATRAAHGSAESRDEKSRGFTPLLHDGHVVSAMTDDDGRNRREDAVTSQNRTSESDSIGLAIAPRAPAYGSA